MKYILCSTYNLCNNEKEFNKLLREYPILEKYEVKYDYSNNKAYIAISDNNIMNFIKEIEEDIIISISKTKIIIDDNAL